MRFSVVTATFNREKIVSRAIDSALKFVSSVGDSEIVVVDDASQDNSVDMIRTNYAAELQSGLLKLVERQINGGSTAAKSDGAKTASGDWIIFLDSDDELLPEAAKVIPDFIATDKNPKLFFFRVIDQSGRLVGPPWPPTKMPLLKLLNEGLPGECLPVADRVAFLEHPSETDPMAYEMMAYLRITRSHGYALVSELAARCYHMDGSDRITSRAGNLRRVRKHIAGFERMFEEFGGVMTLRHRWRLLIRLWCYRAAAVCRFDSLIR